MYAFNGYCYPSSGALVAAASSIAGQGAGAWVLEDAAISGSDLVLSYRDASDAPQSITRPLVTCSDVGPLATYIGTGISVADASALAFGIVAVWLVGWAVSAIRRTLDDVTG